jgi:hypothetical protein
MTAAARRYFLIKQLTKIRREDMLKIHPNVGSKDRMIRIGAGAAIIAAGAFLGSWWGAIGIVPIATGVFRWCPAYVPMGISTCESGEECGHRCGKSESGQDKTD